MIYDTKPIRSLVMVSLFPVESRADFQMIWRLLHRFMYQFDLVLFDYWRNEQRKFDDED